jgi:hypothetical protein
MAENGILRNVSPENCFWASNGAIIKNLQELENAIGYMGDDTFRNHVNESKNDFGTWVKEVVADEELASQMSQTTDRTRTQLLIVKRVLKALQK